ncbi:MAG: hypothetical protein KDC80_20980 [Saprospiraceae bacterium]|nr:hypothetical protein [Saprospiraceae bacterium]
MISTSRIVVFWISAFLLLMSCRENITPLRDNWEKAIPQQRIPTGLVSIRASDCGICHQEIYKEWQLSTHAHAWTDLQFQAELRKESSPYLCINCHIPLENQQEYLIKGLIDGDIYKPVKEKNPKFDSQLQEEGISCSTCHVRDGYIIGVNGYPNPPHPVKIDTAFLSEQICLTCHNANAVVTPELVCTFETGDEWEAGPFYGVKNCISCHMDTISRPLIEGTPERTSHRHWFAGSGIPKRKGIESKGLEGLQYKTDTLASSYHVGDRIPFEISLTNSYAGHRLPTGDPERFYIIELVWESLDDHQVVQREEFRIGETWEWYPEAKKLTDNNLEPGESRIFKIDFIPKEYGTYNLTVKVTKHRMDEETAAYNQLGEEYPLSISVFEWNHTIQVE